METENILMEAVAAGGDRQDLHERIRIHSVECANQVKTSNSENDLMQRIRGDENFQAVNLDRQVNPLDFVGRSREQVDEFCQTIVAPIREKLGGQVTQSELRV